MNELVVLQDKQAVTSSLKICEVFKKEHGKVIRAIENHIKDLEDVGEPKVAHEFFYKTTYTRRGREYPKYLMNRDGFSLLVMSFNNTRDVLDWKLKYIEAFNKMESQLRNRIPTNFTEALELALNQAKELETKNQIIGELKPKADYVDKILKSKSLVTITQIAKDYGMSGRSMNIKLNELGIQYKQSDQWLLYQKYQAKGYTHSETFVINDVLGLEKTVMNTKWTQKGRLFLYEELKEHGIIPTIEKAV